jgi:hypothetical protein
MDKLSHYKKNINLIRFLENNGFSIDKNSTKNSVRLKNRNNQLFIVYKKNGEYRYFEPGNGRNKSIVDFVIERSNNFSDVFIKLDKYIKDNKDYNADLFDIAETSNPEIFDDLKNNIKNLSDKNFLHSRGITSNVINSDQFKHTLFQSVFISTKYNEITNTGFKATDLKGKFIALSLRNFDYKMKAGNVAASLVHSYPEINKIDSICYAESFIDCMSYYQMYNNNALFLSSEGALTSEQINLISYAADRSKKDLSILTDNDLAGDSYAVDLLLNINSEHYKHSSQNKFIECGIDKDTAISLTNIVAERNINDISFIYTNDISLNFIKNAGIENKASDINVTENFIKLSFVTLADMFNAVKLIKFYDTSVKRERALTNDFNQDLMAQIGIDSKYKIINNVAVKLNQAEISKSVELSKCLKNEIMKARMRNKYDNSAPCFNDYKSLKQYASNFNFADFNLKM